MSNFVLYFCASSVIGSLLVLVIGMAVACRRLKKEKAAAIAENIRLQFDLNCMKARFAEQKDTYAALLRDLDDKNIALDRREKAKKFCELIGFTREKDWSNIDKKILWDRVQARYYKIKEELHEYLEALRLHEFTGCVDSLTDIAYSVEVSYWLLGVDGDKAFEAVHASNMTKDYLTFKRDRKGKGPGFKEPDWQKVLEPDKEHENL